MAVTEWIGTTTDGSLDANWNNGVPDVLTTHVLLGGSSILDIATGFGSIRAKQTLTISAGPIIATNTVTIDSKVYTFVAAPSADGEVDVGATDAISLTNLLAAINLSGTVGTEYGSGMTKHTTCVAVSTTATTLIAAFGDAGVGGDGTAVSTTGGTMTWGAGTMTGGAADSASMANIYIEPPYTGDIHTSGTKAPISCGIIFHRGSGQINIDFVNCNRAVIDSSNYGLAADLIMTSSLVMLEVVRGRAKLHCPGGTAMPDRIWVEDLAGLSENLRLTGDSSLTGTQLIVASGQVSINGPNWTSVENLAGVLTIVSGAVTTLRSSGFTILKSTDTMAIAYVTAGDLDLTQGAGAKSVTNVWLGRQANFHRRDDIDTFTLHEIGRK